MNGLFSGRLPCSSELLRFLPKLKSLSWHFTDNKDAKECESHSRFSQTVLASCSLYSFSFWSSCLLDSPSPWSFLRFRTFSFFPFRGPINFNS